MSKNVEVWIMIKKEMAKFLGNRRIVFSTVILPGLVIAVLYSAMGQFMEKKEAESHVFEAVICVINMPESMENLFDNIGMIWREVDASEMDTIKKQIEDKKEVLLVNFPENFQILSNSLTQTCPNIEIYYNASSTESYNYFIQVNELLETYENSIANVFDINQGDSMYNLSTEREGMGKNIAMILPTLLMGLIFSACMPIAAESIAGEKEHGTMATLLVTPVKRYNIALAKITSLSIMALGGAISSYVGIVFSLPRFLNITGKEMLQVYEFKDYILLLFTLITLILIMIAVMSIVSTGAKTIKEASTSLSPFAAVAMLLGMTCMIQDNAIVEHWIYFIPFYNNVQVIYSILNFETNTVNFTIMFISNLCYVGICILVLTKMFKNERAMFG